MQLKPFSPLKLYQQSMSIAKLYHLLLLITGYLLIPQYVDNTLSALAQVHIPNIAQAASLVTTFTSFYLVEMIVQCNRLSWEHV